MPLFLQPPACRPARPGECPVGEVPAVPAHSPRTFWINVGTAAVLFLLIGLVYYPSLDHGPRGDQWCFLLDTIDQDGFLPTLARTYSYNRTRAVAPGDYQLFRPVLFGLLSAEKALFGNNFSLWQAVGIGLHGLAVFLLLQVLLLTHRLFVPDAGKTPAGGWLTERRLLKWLAYGVALFFALNFAGVEMVIWSHINGYLLFVVLALGASLLTLKVLAEPEATPAKQGALLAGAFLLVLLSAFTYEIGQFFAVCTGAVLAGSALRNGRPVRGLVLFVLFASVLPLYRGVDRLDRAAHPHAWDTSLKAIKKRALSAQTLEHTARYLRYCAVQPFFPSRAAWEVGERVVIPEPGPFWETCVRPEPALLLSLAVLGAGLFLTLRGLFHWARGGGKVHKLLIFLLPFSLLALHGTVIVLGRMNLRPGPGVISTNSYYAYIPLLGFLAGLYVTWTWAASGTARRRPVLFLPVYAILLVGLVVLGAVSGVKVHRLNVEEKEPLRALHGITDTVQEFIDAHQEEPGFRFAFDSSVSAAIQSTHGIPLPIILFKRYVDNYHPRYLFSLEGSKLVAHGYEGPVPSQVAADLVQVGTPYNFYYFDGWYYGVRRSDGCYRPDRKDYAYLIQDRTLEGAEGQVDGKLAEERAGHR